MTSPGQTEPKSDVKGAVYVRRPVDDRVWEQIDEAVRMTLAGPEGRGVVLTAPSGAGKSTLLTRAMARHPAVREAVADGVKVLEVETPAPCTLSELGRIVAMRASGYVIRAGASSTVAWDGARRAMAAEGIRILRVDEAQNVVRAANETERGKLLDTIRMLLVTRGENVALIMSGQSEFEELVKRDEQIRRRSSFASIPSVDASLHPAVEAGIRALAKRAGIPVSAALEPILTDELVPRLTHAALAQFGSALERAAMTIAHALRAKDARGRPITPAKALEMEHFASHWAMNTGNASFMNPFVSPDWRAIDCCRRNVTHPSQLGPDPRDGRNR